jgi:hypothetical protein
VDSHAAVDILFQLDRDPVTSVTCRELQDRAVDGPILLRETDEVHHQASPKAKLIVLLLIEICTRFLFWGSSDALLRIASTSQRSMFSHLENCSNTVSKVQFCAARAGRVMNSSIPASEETGPTRGIMAT